MTTTETTQTETRPERPLVVDRYYRGVAPHLVMIYDGGTLVGPLPHRLVRHSPDGFSWGYGGSGPADLALNLLIDAFGEDAWCKTCGGTGTANSEGGYCPDCRGDRTSGFVTRRAYQAFKAEVVARWPMDKDWRISRMEIRAFAAAQGPDDAP